MKAIRIRAQASPSKVFVGSSAPFKGDCDIVIRSKDGKRAVAVLVRVEDPFDGTDFSGGSEEVRFTLAPLGKDILLAAIVPSEEAYEVRPRDGESCVQIASVLSVFVAEDVEVEVLSAGRCKLWGEGTIVDDPCDNACEFAPLFRKIVEADAGSYNGIVFDEDADELERIASEG